VIGNGIDADGIPAPDERAENPLRGSPRLLFVGRLVPQKGVDVLIEAFRLAAPTYPGAVLTIVGDGPKKADLRSQVEDAGLGARIDFAGQLTDPYPYFRGADVLIAPSRYEGFSNTVLEALVCGTPVITTADAGAGDEVVRPGFNGQLAATADPALVAEAIGRQLSQPHGRGSTSQATSPAGSPRPVWPASTRRSPPQCSSTDVTGAARAGVPSR